MRIITDGEKFSVARYRWIFTQLYDGKIWSEMDGFCVSRFSSDYWTTESIARKRLKRLKKLWKYWTVDDE